MTELMNYSPWIGRLVYIPLQSAGKKCLKETTQEALNHSLPKKVLSRHRAYSPLTYTSPIGVSPFCRFPFPARPSTTIEAGTGGKKTTVSLASCFPVLPSALRGTGKRESKLVGDEQ
jgi:hypothetical protein